MNGIFKKVFKNWNRFFSIFLAVIVFFEAIPQNTVKTEAKLNTEWEQIQTSFGTPIAGAYGNGKFVLLNDNKEVYISNDGDSWEYATTLMEGNDDYRDILFHMKYVNNYFFMLGMYNDVYMSKDGYSWGNINLEGSHINDVSYDSQTDTYYFLTGYYGINSGHLYVNEAPSIYSWNPSSNEISLAFETDLNTATTFTVGNESLVCFNEWDGWIVTYGFDGQLINTYKIDKDTDQSTTLSAIEYYNDTFYVYYCGLLFESKDGLNWNSTEIKKENYSNLYYKLPSFVFANQSLYIVNEKADSFYDVDLSKDNISYNKFGISETVSSYLNSNYNAKIVVLANENAVFLASQNYVDKKEMYHHSLQKREDIEEFTISDNSAEYVDDDIYLTADYEIAEDYIISGKQLHLNGHTLIVNGSMSCYSANIDTDNGVLIVGGDFHVLGDTSISGEYQVHGDLIVEKNELLLEHAKVEVDGDLNILPDNYGIGLTHEEDSIIVHGNFSDLSKYVNEKSNGKITVNRNVELGEAFNSSGDFVLELNGVEEQKLCVNNTSYIANVVFNNTSDQGIVMNQNIHYGHVDSNNCVLSYEGENIKGIWGFTLEQDTVIDDDLYIVNGDMHLNGYKLTVNGNYVQAFGNLYIEKGSMYVENNMSFQFKDSYKYYAGSTLYMVNPEDYLYVKNDFTYNSSVSTLGNLTQGRMEIGGGFYNYRTQQTFNATSPHTIKFLELSDQVKDIHGYYSNYNQDHTRFGILELESDYKNKYSLIYISYDQIVYLNDTELPSSVNDLKVDRITGNTVRFTWSPSKDNTAIRGYKLYRNNELYQNDFLYNYSNSYYSCNLSGDAVKESASYYITAVDVSGNESEKGNEVVIQAEYPSFTAITPASGTVLGKNQSLYVAVKQTPGFKYNTVRVYYIDNNEKEIDIYKATVSDWYSSSSRYQYNYNTTNWNLTDFTQDQDITVYFEISDYGNCKTVEERTYHIDRIGPEPPKAVSLEEGEKSVIISWSQSESSDVAYYNIYRSEKGSSEKEYIRGVYSNLYPITDSSVEDNKTYIYYIQAQDTCGNYGEFLVSDEIFIHPDIEVPVIKSYNNYTGKQKGQVYFPLNATDNRHVKKYQLYYRKSDENIEKDILLGELGYGIQYKSDYVSSTSYNSSNNTGYIYIDTLKIEDAEYTFSIYAIDDSGNKSLPAETTFTIDNTAPVSPQRIKTEATCNSIKICWDAFREKDFERVYIEQQVNGIWRSYTNTKDNFILISNLSPETTYTYRMRSGDDIYNYSNYTDDIVVTTSKDLEPPQKMRAPILRTRSGSKVSLYWSTTTDNIGVTGYRLYRNGELLKSFTTSTTTFIDSGLENETEYTYEVTAVDKAGNESTKSDSLVVITALPIISDVSPKEGSDIGTNQTKLYISLEGDVYSQSRKIDLSYFDVNQSEWKSIYNGNMTTYSNIVYKTNEIKWDTSSLLEDQIVQMKVTVTDVDGNSSIKEFDYHLDRTAPKIPSSITGTEKDANITLNWNPSEDDDCKTYTIYRKPVSANDISVDYEYLATYNHTGKELYTHVDPNLIQNEIYSYYLELEDIWGNVSKSEPIDVLVETDMIAPFAPNVSIRRRTGSSITIAWNGARDNVAVTAYNIYRDGKLIAENITGNEYKDSGADLESGFEINTPYLYTVTAKDEAGNESNPSSQTEGVVFMPYINYVQPKDQELIGTDQVTLCCNFKDSGNSINNKVYFYLYNPDLNEWEILNTDGSLQQSAGYGALSASYTYDIPQMEKGEDIPLDFKVVLVDEDLNQDERLLTLIVDQTPPNPPQNLKVEENSGVTSISFVPSSSEDTQGYFVYRRSNTEEEFTKIEQLSGRTKNYMYDRSVKEGKQYQYYVTAYDGFGMEGEPSEYSPYIRILEDVTPPKIASMKPESGDVNGNVTIDVVGEDNIAVTKISLFIKKSTNEDWTLLNEAETNDNTLHYELDSTQYPDDQYEIKAVAYDDAGNTNKNLYQRRYRIDNSGPEKIILRNCYAGISSIHLEWEDVEDVAYFAVERCDNYPVSEGEIANWNVVEKVTDKVGVNIANHQPNKSYAYRVVGYDRLNNRGIESEEIILTTSLDTNVPVIKRIEPISSSYGDEILLSMTVNDDCGMEEGIFSYSYNGTDFEELSRIRSTSKSRQEIFQYSFQTSDLPEGQIYIRFEAFDTSGNHNALISEKQIENTYIIDHTAPAKVSGLTVAGKSGTCELTWDENKEEDLMSYRIYRSQSMSGTYYLLKEINSKNYYDKNVTMGGNYYYKISAVDMAGNESELSEYAFVSISPDKVLPQVKSITAYTGFTVGKTTPIYVVASDNMQLAKVQLEYREKNSLDIWRTITEFSSSKRDQIFETTWDVDGLDDSKQYELRAIATDIAGNVSEELVRTFHIDTTAPISPVISAQTGGYQINLSISADKSSDFSGFEIYRRLSGENEFQYITTISGDYYIDKNVEPNVVYYYKVFATDIYGNRAESNMVYSHASNEDVIAPVAVLPETIMAVTGLPMRFDGTKSSDNVRIQSYEWFFDDDNTTKYGSRPSHTYKEAGTYFANLTVRDAAGNSNTARATVIVLDSNTNGMSNLRVIDTDGNPISGAYVYIKMGNEDENIIHTFSDNNGELIVSGKAGVYEIAAYAEGYLPKTDTIRVSNYEKISKEIVLPKGDVVTGDISIRRLTPEELVDLNVNLQDPVNYHIFKFKVEMTLEESPLPVVYESLEPAIPIYRKADDYRPEASPSPCSYIVKAHDPKGNYVQAIVEDNGEPEIKTVVRLSTTQTVSWLKDMYNVDLDIINHADSEFYIEKCSASLNLPKGLSKVDSSYDDSNRIKDGKIYGQTSHRFSWVVRADESGKYKISADFGGRLMPFETDIAMTFEAEEELEVFTGEGLHLLIEPESALYTGETYYVQFTLSNRSNRTFYNLETTFGDYETPASKTEVIIKDPQTGEILGTNSQTDGQTYVYPSANECRKRNYYIFGSKSNPQNEELSDGMLPNMFTERDKIVFGVFEPDEEIKGTIKFSVSGDDEETYFKLIDTLVDVLEGENLGVEVEVKPKPSHMYKYIYVGYMGGGSSNDMVMIGDPIDISTGSFTQDIHALNIGDSLAFNLSYNSVLSQKRGQCGYGFSHSFETSLEELNSTISLHTSASTNLDFIHEDILNNTVYGYKSGDTIVISPDTSYLGDFLPVNKNMKGCKITKLFNEEDKEVYYKFIDAENTETLFNKEGQIIKQTKENGKTISFAYSDNKVTVYDRESKEKIYITYENGYVKSVQDDHDREASFEYDQNGNLVSFTNVLGDKTTFDYDSSHHMVRGFDALDRAIFENTYDSNGRVTAQKEAGNDKYSYITYFNNTIELREKNQTIITVKRRDNQKETYLVNSENRILEYTNANGQVTKYLYNKDGDLLDEIAPDNSTVMYEYDDNGHVQAIYDTAANVTKYTYDSHGNPIRIEGNDGNKTINAYNDYGQLISSTSPNKVKTTYEYDDLGNLLKETIEGLGSQEYEYQNGRRISSTDRLGNKSSVTYDEYGNVNSSTDALGRTTLSTYDQAGHLLETINPKGEKTTYSYDKVGNQIRVSGNGGSVSYTYDAAGRMTSVTDALSHTTSYQYDSESNVTSIIYSDGSKDTYKYDALGNVISETKRDGSVHTYSYDGDEDFANENGYLRQETVNGLTTKYEYYPNGKLRKVVHPNGNTNSYTYDCYWNLISDMDQDKNTTSYTYDAEGNCLSVTDALGQITSYEYDLYGRKIKETDPNGNSTEYVYDANDRCIETKDASGHSVKYSYDEAGQLVKVSTTKTNHVLDVNNQETVQEVTLEQYFEYDVLGRVIKEKDPKGYDTYYQYDARGNVIRSVDKEDHYIDYSYDLNNQLIQTMDMDHNQVNFSYDAFGNQTEIQIQNVNSEAYTAYAYTYDKAGRVVSSKDALNGTSANTFDKNGNLTKVVDALGYATNYSYNGLNQLVEMTTAIGSKESYTYNAKGLLESVTDAKLQNTTYKYDAIGRIITMEDEEGTIHYTYDKNGNILTVTEEKGLSKTEITRTYDELNRVTSYTDCNGKKVQYSYDELGNLISLTYPGGEIVRYAYDLNSNLTQVWDFGGNLTRYQYDRNGRIKEQIRPDGSVEEYTYDKNGRLIHQEDVASDKTIIHDLEYTYDGNGNITNISGNNAGDITAMMSAVMTYDEDNRLVSFNGQEVSYDANGNMLYGPLQGEMAHFTYDCRNRLIKVETSSGSTSYTYDAENHRIKEQTDELLTEYVVNPCTTYSQVLSETVYGKELLGLYTKELSKKTYTYGHGLISEQRTENANGTSISDIRYYHFDNLGSTTHLTDSKGTILYAISYGPYGELTGITDEYGNTVSLKDANIRFLYNGKLGVETDSNGLYYMRSRYYNADIKRFINRDTVSGDITNSQSLNRYAYVQGNPINQVDPFGLSPIEDDKITVKDFIHTVFDVIGFFWDGADLINGIMYLMEGNTLMASTSLVAAIPFAGSVVASGSKLAFKGSKYAAKACKAAEYIKDTTKLIGYTGQTALSAGVTLSSYQSYKKNRAEGKSTGGDVLNMAIGTIATVAGAGGAISSAKKMSAKLARDGVGEAVKKATKEALGNNRGSAKLIGGDTLKGGKNSETLYHYTNEIGMNGIVESNQLNPSLKANNPKDARYGNGQYLSDIKPDTVTPGQLGKKFINVPNKYKYTNYVEIDVTDLNVVQGRDGVFVIPNETPLDLTNRIVNFGKVGQ